MLIAEGSTVGEGLAEVAEPENLVVEVDTVAEVVVVEEHIVAEDKAAEHTVAEADTAADRGCRLVEDTPEERVALEGSGKERLQRHFPRRKQLCLPVC